MKLFAHRKGATVGRQRDTVQIFVAACVVYVMSLYSFCDWRLANSRETGVISFSLYGSDARYVDGARENARLYEHIFEGWVMRIYHDDTVPSQVLEEMYSRGVQLVNMTGSTKNKMAWRFLAVSDTSQPRACIRDIDSRLLVRDKAAVKAWIASGKSFHVMRDHPSHSLFAISGGMWCAKTKVIPNIEGMLDTKNVGHDYLQDMEFLNSCIWPIVRRSVLQHDSFSCRKYDASPFPVPRIGMEHVGSVFINGEMREDDVVLLKEAMGRGDGRECT